VTDMCVGCIMSGPDDEFVLRFCCSAGPVYYIEELACPSSSYKKRTVSNEGE
jgi:hypothetical protein